MLAALVTFLRAWPFLDVEAGTEEEKNGKEDRPKNSGVKGTTVGCWDIIVGCRRDGDHKDGLRKG